MATEETADETRMSDDQTAGGDGETELGLDANILAALGYVFNLIGAVVLLVLEDNEYVRHHAAQALLFTGVVVVARFVLRVLGVVIGFLPGGGLINTVLGLVVWAGAALGFLFLAYKAFAGERYELPVLGEFIDDVEGMF
jgi:uncharacterized membrane protein